MNLRIFNLILFLGALAKLLKETISFVMSVCLSIRMEQLDSHWTDFDEIFYLFFFSKVGQENLNFINIRQE